MRSIMSLGRVLALVLAVIAAAAPAAWSQTFWSQDYSISDGDVNDTFTSLGHQRFAAVDDSNNLYICFFDNRNKVGSDNNFEIYIRRFTFNFGSPYITRVTNAYNPSRYPSMAILNWGRGDSSTVADSGRVYLAWQDSRLFDIPLIGEPKSYVIFFRTFQSRGGEAFGPEMQVSDYDSVNAATGPSITVDPSHTAWMFWQKSNNGGNPELYYRTYDATTRTLGGAVQQLTFDGAFSGNASVASTRDGEVHVTWVDTRTGGNQIWWKHHTPGVGWSADEQIVFSAGSASGPSLVADYRGHLHLVWVDNRSGNNDIFYKEFTPGSGWDPVDTQVTTNASSQTQPYIDADPMGNVYVVWTDQRNGSSNPDIFYQERKGGVWAPADLELVSNLTDNNASRVQRFPGITHDGLGTTYVAWSDERMNSSQGTNKEAFYKYGLFNVTAAPVAPPTPASRLLSAYPNPFNPQATVRFDLRRDGTVTLRAFDVQGRIVRTLLDGYVASGVREVPWDGRDDSGRALPSGTYFLRLTAPGTFLTKSVSLVK